MEPSRGEANPRRGKRARQPVSRVLSTSRKAGRPFLWDASRDAPHATNPSDRTGTSLRSVADQKPATTTAAPIRSCSRWGLPCRPCCQGRGALLPHRFALARGTRNGLARAVCFLWHCPWGRPRRPLAGTVFPWSPDFPLRQPQRPSSCLAPPTRAPGRRCGQAERPGLCPGTRKGADAPFDPRPWADMGNGATRTFQPSWSPPFSPCPHEWALRALRP